MPKPFQHLFWVWSIPLALCLWWCSGKQQEKQCWLYSGSHGLQPALTSDVTPSLSSDESSDKRKFSITIMMIP